jgi:hypothetical protein
VVSSPEESLLFLLRMRALQPNSPAKLGDLELTLLVSFGPFTAMFCLCLTSTSMPCKEMPFS